MNNLIPTEPGGLRSFPRSFVWLRIVSLALVLAALAAPAAFAGVEFVTPIGNCTNKVDTIGDGKDLFIGAGPRVQFEVFGNAVDMSNPTTGFRIATDSGAGKNSSLSFPVWTRICQTTRMNRDEPTLRAVAALTGPPARRDRWPSPA